MGFRFPFGDIPPRSGGESRIHSYAEFFWNNFFQSPNTFSIKPKVFVLSQRTAILRHIYDVSNINNHVHY